MIYKFFYKRTPEFCKKHVKKRHTRWLMEIKKEKLSKTIPISASANTVSYSCFYYEHFFKLCETIKQVFFCSREMMLLQVKTEK